MKKKILYILLFICTFSFLSLNVFALEEEDLHSNEVLLVNLDTDEVIFSKNTKDGPVSIASLTKLMTYALTVENIQDLENTMITVPEGIQATMKAKYASVANLIDGYSYSALDLLYGMMLPSGCDAAEVLATYIGGGDSQNFVDMMNAKAQELGMTNTTFVDSYGIGTADANDISTEQDLYKLIKYVYKLPYFKKIISTEYIDIVGTKDEETDYETMRNTNYLMGEYSGGAYYYPYTIGGKTGSLGSAGKCLITIAVKGDLTVVAITLGVPGQSNSTYDYNLTDHIKLFDYLFNELTDNITVDIGPVFRSMEVGKQLKIDATTSEETDLVWESSDETVATVDQDGIVTGVSQGQTIITAKTSTGNIAETHVSVNFYNGVHVKYSTGPALDEGWDSIDFSILKNKGFDYVVVRAGYGNDTEDPTFLKNFESAVENEMNIGIWFEGYAKDVESAEAEAANLLAILDKVSENKDKINLPVFYNMYYSKATNVNDILTCAEAFKKIVEEQGYSVLLELGKTKLSQMEDLDESDMELSVIWRTTPPDYKTDMTVGEKEATVWNYKNNAYLGNDNNLGTNASFSLLYMKNQKLTTIHKEYFPPQEENTDDIVVEPQKEATTGITNTNTYSSPVKNTYNDLTDTVEQEKKEEEPKKEEQKEEKKDDKKNEKKEKKEESNSLDVLPLIIAVGSVLVIALIAIVIVNRKKD